MLEGWWLRTTPPALLLCLATPAAAADPRCQLPTALTESLAAYAESLGELPDAQEPGDLVVKCLAALHATFLLVCESLFALPDVARVTRGGPFQREGWRGSLGAWASGQEERLRDWAVRRPECVAPKLQLRVAGAFAEDFGSQLAVLAKAARGDSGRGMALHWIFRFQSAWSMTLYYLACLQYFSLSAFDPSNDLAYHLHRHRYPETPGDPGAAWWSTVLAIPTFRLPEAEPLRINAPRPQRRSAQSAAAAPLKRLAAAARRSPPECFSLDRNQTNAIFRFNADAFRCLLQLDEARAECYGQQHACAQMLNVP